MTDLLSSILITLGILTALAVVLSFFLPAAPVWFAWSIGCLSAILTRLILEHDG